MGPFWSPRVALLLGDLVGYFPALYAAWPAAWDPFVQGGTPLLPNPQAGAFYPPAWLLALDLHAGHPPYVALHLFAGALACWGLARRALGDGPEAALAGVVFALSGPSVSLALTPDKLPGHAAFPACLLGVLLAADGATGRERGGGLLLAAGAAAAAWLGGSVEVAIALFVVAPAFAALLPGTSLAPAAIVRRVAIAVAALVLGVGLAGCLLVPFFALLPHTDRAGVLPLAEAMERAAHPVDWIGWVAPNPFWRGESLRYVLDDAGTTRARWLRSLYGGAPLVALVPALALARARVAGTRRLVLLIALLVVLALGDASPVGPLVHRLPALGAIRYPDKWWAMSVPFQAVLAAAALHAVRRERRAAVGGLVGVAALAAVGLWGLGLAGGGPLARGAAALATALPGLAAAGIALGLLAAGRRGGSVAAALVAVVGLDLLAAAWAAFPRGDEDAARTPSAAARAIRADHAPRDGSNGPPRLWDHSLHVHNRLPDAPHGPAYRAMERDVLAPNLGVPHGVAYVDGMRVPRTARQRQLSGPLEDLPAPQRRHLLRLAGADYWLVYGFDEALALARAEGLRPVPAAPGTSLPVGLLAEPDPLPRLRLVTRWEPAPADRVLDRVLALLDPGVTVLAEDDAAALPAPSGAAPPPVAARALGSGRWEARWDGTEGLVVLSEGFAPGWEASLDGGPFRPCVPVDHAFVGAFAPAGTRHATLRYRAPGRVAGTAVTFASAGLALLAAWVLVGRSRRGT